MIRKKSFAKINLYLEITGKSTQGYHLLDSLMAYLDICDEISLKKSQKFNLKIIGENATFLNSDQKENIIIKTVNLLAKKYHFDPKIEILLTKNIPIGAGLGGGSANSATILLMLNQFYNLNLSDEKLKEIGLEIGSDVPFCLNQKIALVNGIGEKISQVTIGLKPLFALLVNPRKTLSTKDVFELFSAKYLNKTKEYKPQKISENSSIISIIENRQNYLEEPATELIPEIDDILKTLQNQQNCLISRMSGSGATCFGLFENINYMDLAEKKLKQKFPEFYIKKSQLIYST